MQTGTPGWLDWIRNRDAALSVFLPLLVASTVLSWPLRELFPVQVFDALFVATVLFGVLVVVPSPRIAVLAGIVGTAVTLQRLLGVGRLNLLEVAPSLVLFVLISAALLVRVFRPGRITVHRLLGAVALFLVLGVTWGLAFQAVQVVHPDAILMNGKAASPQEAMWLSFVTLTTVGYGDVVPVHPLARSLATLEALTGVLFPSVLIGFLLSQVATSSPADGHGGPGAT
jgi:voltage-gated potassium channel Kch